MVTMDSAGCYLSVLLLLIDDLLAVTNIVLVAERFAVVVVVACNIAENLMTKLFFASDDDGN